MDTGLEYQMVCLNPMLITKENSEPPFFVVRWKEAEQKVEASTTTTNLVLAFPS